VKEANPNTLWAETLMEELARSGVREVCLAPGSRSTPLVLAAARQPELRLFPLVDERSAGFFALGLGKATGRPAAVVTTSGTAGANLYPAVIEASQGDVPLLVLTADRPRRLSDTDGNQSMDQLRLFGGFPRAFFHLGSVRIEDPYLAHLRAVAARSVAAARGAPPGPVHLNLPFEKPLEPGPEEGDTVRDPVPALRIPPRRFRVEAREVDRVADLLARARRGLIVAGPVPDGHVVGPRALALAEATGFPLLADPLSGARYAPKGGATVPAAYDLFLRSPEVARILAPELVLRVGGSPTSAATVDYLRNQDDAAQVVVDQGFRWKDHTGRVQGYLQGAPEEILDRLAERASGTRDPEWLQRWEEVEGRALAVLEGWGLGRFRKKDGGAGEGREPEEGILEGAILAAVVRTLPEGASLLVGNSMPIRDLDAFAHPREERLRVVGNRGVSGIDGLVSTALGLASGSKGPTVGVLGDLSLHHDMNGLLAMRDGRIPAVLVVVNNDGGGIFHLLPVRDHEPPFTELFATPHGLDFRLAAELYRIPFHRARSVEELRTVLARALARDEPLILEIRTHREETHRRRRELVEGVLEAFRTEPTTRTR
jgi:2-succinyl-5-enolpyruvyl-6-hydroxy-3-cyclohexene-1-carboxylate synthase